MSASTCLKLTFHDKMWQCEFRLLADLLYYMGAKPMLYVALTTATNKVSSSNLIWMLHG